MMFRCPYCKKEFPPQDTAFCPNCGKAMMIPRKYRKTPVGSRHHRLNPELRREQRIAKYRAPLLFARRNPHLAILFTFALLAAGGLLLSRSVHRPSLSTAQKEQLAQIHLVYLTHSLTYFFKDCGRYPTTDEGLQAILVNPGLTNWRGPYKVYGRTFLVDPWTNAYRYVFSNDLVHLTSDGPDGIPNSPDDLKSPFFYLTNDEIVRKIVEAEIDAQKDAGDGTNATDGAEGGEAEGDGGAPEAPEEIEVMLTAPAAPGSPQ